jgi:MYXO-CTERM domain-containing protein
MDRLLLLADRSGGIFMRYAILVLSALALPLSVASVAEAHGTYQQAVPNGLVNGCTTCHLPGLDHLRNLFGATIEPLALADEPMAEWWPAVRELDADLDGQTNAQELGDPCLTWIQGMSADRTTNISNPGDEMDLSSDPDSCMDPMGEGGGSGEGGSSGGGDGGTGGSEPPPDNGNPPEAPQNPSNDPWNDPAWQTPEPRSGCSFGGSDSLVGWWLVAVAAYFAARRRRSTC